MAAQVAGIVTCTPRTVTWVRGRCKIKSQALSKYNEEQKVVSQWTLKICITFVQCWTNVEDVGPTLYKCYTNVLYFLGYDLLFFRLVDCIYLFMSMCTSFNCAFIYSVFLLQLHVTHFSTCSVLNLGVKSKKDISISIKTVPWKLSF